MKTKPILFNSDMVRALLDGRKGQTRRPINPQPDPQCDKVIFDSLAQNWAVIGGDSNDARDYGLLDTIKCPLGKPGDMLWVREAFCSDWGDDIAYKADDHSGHGARNAGYIKEPKYKPSIHMPRWVSRLTLKISDVRVERVQDITEEDAKSEGVPKLAMDEDRKFYQLKNEGSYRTGFAGVWNHIYSSWDDNPYIWAASFDVIKANVDAALNEEAA